MCRLVSTFSSSNFWVTADEDTKDLFVDVRDTDVCMLRLSLSLMLKMSVSCVFEAVELE